MGSTRAFDRPACHRDHVGAFGPQETGERVANVVRVLHEKNFHSPRDGVAAGQARLTLGERGWSTETLP